MTIDADLLSGPHTEVSTFLWEEISSHYARTGDPLLLSNLGFALAGKNLSLPDGEPLRVFLEKHFGDRVRLVRDPNRTTAFIVALAKDETGGAEESLAERPFVDLAPRPLLLAFCMNVPEGAHVFYRPMPPRYAVGDVAPDDAYVEVDSELRLPGRRIEIAEPLEADLRQQLEERIGLWAKRHHLKRDDIKKHASSTKDSVSKDFFASNALQRLLTAQTEDVRRRLLIPGDIADKLMRIR